jgi:hypothetical protein
MILEKPKLYKVFRVPDKVMRWMDFAVGILCIISTAFAYPNAFWMAFWLFFALVSFILFFTNGTARFQRWITEKAKLLMLVHALKLPKK